MDRWLADPQLSEWLSRSDLEVEVLQDLFAEHYEKATRALFAPVEAKVAELLQSDAFAEAVLRGLCPFCGEPTVDIADGTWGTVTLHQAPPCERFAALRPAGGGELSIEFVGYLLPPSPGVGVQLKGPTS